MNLVQLILLPLCFALSSTSEAVALTPLKPQEYLDKISEAAGIPWVTLRNALLEPSPAHLGQLRVSLIRAGGTERWKTEIQALDEALRIRVETACKMKDRDGDPCGAAREEARRFRELNQTLGRVSKKKGASQGPSLTVLAAILFARTMHDQILPREEGRLRAECPQKTTFTPPGGNPHPSACELYRTQLKQAVRAVVTAVDLAWAQVNASTERGPLERELRETLKTIETGKGT